MLVYFLAPLLIVLLLGAKRVRGLVAVAELIRSESGLEKETRNRERSSRLGPAQTRSGWGVAE